MKRPLLTPALILLPFALIAVAGIWMATGGGDDSSKPVAFSEVEPILSEKCSGCHPGVVKSLDLTAGNAYTSIVGVRSVEAPELPYVVAGDPEHSFLYLKVAGWPGNDGEPIVGARMPFGEGPLDKDQIETLRRWIDQGAKNADGVTQSADEVPTPGSLPKTVHAAPPAALEPGDGSISGIVSDAEHKPIAGAVVALLVVRDDLPAGEEHYLAGTSGADGRYTIRNAPVGRVLIKAYAPKTVYVSRVLETKSGSTTGGDVGLPVEVQETPDVAQAQVTRAGDKLKLAMDVTGAGLDQNYTLAVNSESGRVFELRSEAGGEKPGTWSRQVPAEGLTGSWTFVAISHGCNVSRFLTAATPA